MDTSSNQVVDCAIVYVIFVQHELIWKKKLNFRKFQTDVEIKAAKQWPQKWGFLLDFDKVSCVDVWQLTFNGTLF